MNTGLGTLAVPTGIMSLTASPLPESVDHALTVAIAENSDTLTPTSVRFAYLAVMDLLSAATGYTMGREAASHQVPHAEPSSWKYSGAAGRLNLEIATVKIEKSTMTSQILHSGR